MHSCNGLNTLNAMRCLECLRLSASIDNYKKKIVTGYFELDLQTYNRAEHCMFLGISSPKLA